MDFNNQYQLLQEVYRGAKMGDISIRLLLPKVDNARFKAQFQKKAKMLTPDEALAFTGHAVGGICPFAIENPQVRVFLDVSLKRFETVFPACGSSNSAIELTCGELEAYSKALEWVDVCKGWREEERENG